MTDEPAGRWSVAFGRSSLSPLIFTVKPGSREAVRTALTDLGVVIQTEEISDGGSPVASPKSHEWSVARLLDGYVVTMALHAFFGDYRLPNGMWVVGVRPLYLLIQLLGLAPPSRPLRGVPDWDRSADLVAEAQAQIAAGQQEPDEDAPSPWGICEPGQLADLAGQLFGGKMAASERAVAAATWRPFSGAEQQEFEAAGFSLEDAMAWVRLGFAPKEVPTLLLYDIDTAERWIAAGVSPAGEHLAHFLRHGYRVEDAVALIEAGCPPSWQLEPFLATADGVEEFRRFVGAGLNAWDAAEYLSRGVRVPQASEWKALGFKGFEARVLIERGWDFDSVRRAVEAGETPYNIWVSGSGPPPRAAQ